MVRLHIAPPLATGEELTSYGYGIVTFRDTLIGLYVEDCRVGHNAQ
jgi:hypothetical protein